MEHVKMIFISKISKCCKGKDDTHLTNTKESESEGNNESLRTSYYQDFTENDASEKANEVIVGDESLRDRKCARNLRTLLGKCLGKSHPEIAEETRHTSTKSEHELPVITPEYSKEIERHMLRKLRLSRRKSAVPFSGELPVPIDKGRTIEVAGKIRPTAIRFSVNLACGNGELCDLAFHLNPRFDQNIVVRSFRRNGRWGDEECAAPARNPLHRGTEFVIAIFAADKEFMVAINGKHYCSYAYRMDLLQISNVEIHGDVNLDYIDYRMTDVYPEKIPSMPEEDVLTQDDILDSIATPYLCTLSELFRSGKCIEIVGRVKRLPHSFYVNLQNGIHLWPHPTIALHINPRFKAGNCVILNSWVDQQWGTEETGPLLFTPGRPFLISIACHTNDYKVMLDGVDFGQYKHRAAPELVTALFIQGDVFIKSIRMR